MGMRWLQAINQGATFHKQWWWGLKYSGVEKRELTHLVNTREISTHAQTGELQRKTCMCVYSRSEEELPASAEMSPQLHVRVDHKPCSHRAASHGHSSLRVASPSSS